MSLIDKIPQMDDAALKNLLDERPSDPSPPRAIRNQVQAQAAELLPALESRRPPRAR